MALPPSSNVDRAAQIMLALRDCGSDGMLLGELAASVDDEKTAVLRALTALAKYGFVEQLSRRGRYVLGPATYGLAMKSLPTRRIVEIARPLLVKCSQATGGTSYLMMKSGLDGLCIDFEEGRFYIPISVGGVGGRHPLGFGASSFCMMAELDDKTRREILIQNAKRLNVEMDVAHIMAEIKLCESRGYAAYENPKFGGGFNVAMGLPFERFKCLCALSVTLPEVTRATTEHIANTLRKIIYAEL